MLSAIDSSTVPITVASLLDHMDWMTDRMINEEVTHLMRKMDHKRGKIFWRTFADEVLTNVHCSVEYPKVNHFVSILGSLCTSELVGARAS